MTARPTDYLASPTFTGLDLSSANFAGEVLLRPRFERCTLSFSTFEGAFMPGAIVDHCVFDPTKKPEFSYARLWGAFITGFHPSNMMGSFRFAELPGATLCYSGGRELGRDFFGSMLAGLQTRPYEWEYAHGDVTMRDVAPWYDSHACDPNKYSHKPTVPGKLIRLRRIAMAIQSLTSVILSGFDCDGLDYGHALRALLPFKRSRDALVLAIKDAVEKGARGDLHPENYTHEHDAVAQRIRAYAGQLFLTRVMACLCAVLKGSRDLSFLEHTISSDMLEVGYQAAPASLRVIQNGRVSDEGQVLLVESVLVYALTVARLSPVLTEKDQAFCRACLQSALAVIQNERVHNAPAMHGTVHDAPSLVRAWDPFIKSRDTKEPDTKEPATKEPDTKEPDANEGGQLSIYNERGTIDMSPPVGEPSPYELPRSARAMQYEQTRRDVRAASEALGDILDQTRALDYATTIKGLRVANIPGPINVSGLRFEKCTFKGCDLHAWDMSGAIFVGCAFDRSYIGTIRVSDVRRAELIGGRAAVAPITYTDMADKRRHLPAYKNKPAFYECDLAGLIVGRMSTTDLKGLWHIRGGSHPRAEPNPN